VKNKNLRRCIAYGALVHLDRCTQVHSRCTRRHVTTDDVIRSTVAIFSKFNLVIKFRVQYSPLLSLPPTRPCNCLVRQSIRAITCLKSITSTMAPSILPKTRANVNPTPTTKVKLITDAERLLGFTAIETTIRDLNREDAANITPIQITGRSGDHDGIGIGTDTASESSIRRYQIVWKGMLDFIIYMQDYQSGMLLHRTACPRNPLPVLEETAIMYMKYHILSPGTPVTHHLTNAVVTVPGRNIILKAVGDWNSCSTIGIYRSALSKLHNAYNTTRGTYIEQCDRCHQIPLARVRCGEGCELHPGKPLFWPLGCVTTSKGFKTNMKLLEEYAE
jgi:hypothetical protein